MYVAMTRAKDRLVLSRAETRRVYGRPERAIPSRFLHEIPKAMIAERDLSASQTTSARFERAYAFFGTRQAPPVATSRAPRRPPPRPPAAPPPRLPSPTASAPACATTSTAPNATATQMRSQESPMRISWPQGFRSSRNHSIYTLTPRTALLTRFFISRTLKWL